MSSTNSSSSSSSSSSSASVDAILASALDNFDEEVQKQEKTKETPSTELFESIDKKVLHSMMSQDTSKDDDDSDDSEKKPKKSASDKAKASVEFGPDTKDKAQKPDDEFSKYFGSLQEQMMHYAANFPKPATSSSSSSASTSSSTSTTSSVDSTSAETLKMLGGHTGAQNEDAFASMFPKGFDMSSMVAQLDKIEKQAAKMSSESSDSSTSSSTSTSATSGADSEGNFDDMLMGMMPMMLSKEFMYPPVKNITGMYPKYIEDNEKKLSKEDLANYKKQYTAFQKMCKVFEDTPDDQNAVLTLMQEIQSYGPPPPELASKLNPFGGADPMSMLASLTAPSSSSGTSSSTAANPFASLMTQLMQAPQPSSSASSSSSSSSSVVASTASSSASSSSSASMANPFASMMGNMSAMSGLPMPTAEEMADPEFQQFMGAFMQGMMSGVQHQQQNTSKKPRDS
eukprot:TRINITY_DN77_c4_g1_i1.p1 TRINITY_DN77_c4_g1~~TRINITY_DN77_c4_g1_i1.p1  ORF type:complete len:456 (+),score=166.78 TRINITY_DN77_c4_g1_i1:50-1417(+)